VSSIEYSFEEQNGLRGGEKNISHRGISWNGTLFIASILKISCMKVSFTEL
jgi:hypothetical protein